MAALGRQQTFGKESELGFVFTQRSQVQTARILATLSNNRLDAAKVDEMDLPTFTKDVVPGVRVGVEHAADQVALEDKPPHRLGEGAPFFFRELTHFSQGLACDELARQHSARGSVSDDLRNANRRIVRVNSAKLRLACCL